MKKHLIILASALTLMLGLSSCGAVADFPGAIFMGNTKPLAVTSNQLGTKVGVAKNVNICNIAVIGDAGINKAAKEAGITKVSHVDVKTTSVLTVFCTKTYYVYGE